MGCTHANSSYSVPINSYDKAKKETQIFRHPFSKQGLLTTIHDKPHITTFQDVIVASAKQHAHRPFLGSREKLKDGAYGPYKWKTYNEVLQMAKKLGSGIINLELAPKHKEYHDLELAFVGVISKNREEFTILDLACCLYGIVLVPIYDTLGDEAREHIFKETNMTTVFCSEDYADKLLKDKKNGTIGKVENIVTFDQPSSSKKEEADKLGLTVFGYDTLIATEEAKLHTFPKIKPENVYTFLYTSGTTGLPKGVMIAHEAIIAFLASVDNADDINFYPTDVHLSVLPAAHSAEKVYQCALIYYGASIGFSCGDIKKLKDELHQLKPTIMPAVPRILERLYEGINAELKKISGVKKTFVDLAIKSKLHNLHSTGTYTHALYDKLIFKKFREALGGRVRFIVVGAAPTDKQVLDFLKIAFCCPIFEAYGLTETTGPCFWTRAKDQHHDYVGGPIPAVEFKLVDCPELHYTSHDEDEQGNVIPRGEVCVRGPVIFKGYYKNEEKTKEDLDKDNWFHTGDIGQIMRNGALKIIDRKKNIFKLAQGEYVAAEKIENVLTKSKFVQEIFVYGDSRKNYLVAAIVVKKDELGASSEEDLQKEEIKEKVIKDLNEAGKAGGLKPFEQVKKVFLDTKSFQENSLMTPSLKLKRNEAKKHYQKELDEMYKSESK
jgi:long-chain acyl-CoA synthetase